MSLVAAAVCPTPPMLVPELAAGAAAELDDLRAACRAAVAPVVSSGADRIFVVGVDGGPRARALLPWGVDVPVDVPEPLPLPLLLGGWLTTGVVRSFVAVDPTLGADDCAALGRDLASSDHSVALLVMGDGSARRDVKAPGHLDERAQPYDDALTAALAGADADALLALDPALAADLLVEGRAPWQVLAGAAAGARFTGDLLYAAAPYGVGYVVATWTRE